MSIVTLPENIKTRLSARLQTWLDQNGDNPYLQGFEKDGIKRTIAYIREVQTGHSHTSSIESRERDFKTFFNQYDERRGKDFVTTFAEETDLLEWVKGIPETTLSRVQGFANGDSSTMTDHIAEELKETAKKEGWVLTPQSANPGAQTFNENT